jgi:uncharacterized protein
MRGDTTTSVSRRLRFSRVPGSFAICRLAPQSGIADWALHGPFFAFASTADEVSIVCAEEQVPADITQENDWVCLKLAGPFSFSETGILAAFVQPLSDRAIPIFAISTFDTDYILVKRAWIEKARDALREAGHEEL